MRGGGAFGPKTRVGEKSCHTENVAVKNGNNRRKVQGKKSFSAMCIGKSFCKNKADACAEEPTAEQLIKQGLEPSTIKFTDSVRPRDIW